MRRKLSLVLTLFAWLLATGSQWDAVQVFAWGKMFAENLRALPLVEAAARTFSLEGRCPLCVKVAEAKQREDGADGAPVAKLDFKIFLACEPAPSPVVAAPDFLPWLRSDPFVRAMTRPTPPVPPPRTFA